MSSSTDHVGAFERLVAALCEGFRREFPASETKVIFGGTTMTLAEVNAALEAMEASLKAVRQARIAYEAAVTARRQAMERHRVTYSDAVLFLKHHLGQLNPKLERFGVKLPKERTPLSVEANAISRAKAAATRQARGIMGRRQREAHGRGPEPTLTVLDPDGRPLGSAPPAAMPEPPALDPSGAP